MPSKAFIPGEASCSSYHRRVDRYCERSETKSKGSVQSDEQVQWSREHFRPPFPLPTSPEGLVTVKRVLSRVLLSNTQITHKCFPSRRPADRKSIRITTNSTCGRRLSFHNSSISPLQSSAFFACQNKPTALYEEIRPSFSMTQKV